MSFSFRAALGLSALALGLSLSPASSAAAGAATTPPPIRHVFIIVLENKNFAETFAPNSPAPYLSKTLVSEGLFLRQYYGVAHLSLGNYIGMVSGQGPNSQTQADCQGYFEFVGPPVLGPDGQAVGQGCVYPAMVKTVADQLAEKGLTWRGYMEDMGTPCRHPNLNGQDTTQQAKANDQYAARHNPFVYFRSIIDTPACAANDVDLSGLTADLASVATTANYSFITPDLCSDGHDGPCVDGRPGGLVSADAFLKEWVPKITSSPAFKQDGMLLVTFDEAEASPNDPNNSDASACCGEGPGPNSPLPGIFGLGGGRVGTVVLSPWVTPGSVSASTYNHYSMLRSVEDLFGLDHLGYAGTAGLMPFGADVYNGPGPSAVAGSTGSGAGSGAGSAAGAARGALPATMIVWRTRT
ncbi:MAG TPA: alkaline phosphatase family protein, partial [Acidimicrobiales bacterium]|nr:alkaline phosphatase family protein [Acidimicrobiales bacterium]